MQNLRNFFGNTTSEDLERFHRRVQTFVRAHEEKQPVRQQWTSLRAVYKCCKNEEQRGDFHRGNIRNVLGTLREIFEYYANESSKSASSISKSIVDVLNCLSNFMNDVREVDTIKRGLYRKTLVGICKRCLDFRVLPEVQHAALMLLMVVAETAEFKDKSVMELVARSINFCPLFTEKFGSHHVYCPIFEKRRVEVHQNELIHATKEEGEVPTHQETIIFFKLFLRLLKQSFCANNWYKFLFEAIMPLFFRFDRHDSDVMVAPPVLIHETLVQWYCDGLANVQMRKILCSSKREVDFIFILFQEAFLKFPLSQLEGLRRILRRYCDWILGRNLPPLLKTESDQYLETITRNIFPALRIVDNKPWMHDDRERKLKISCHVLYIFRLIASQPCVDLSESTWTLLLKQLLQYCDYVLRTSSLHKPLVDRLLPYLLQTLFQCFLNCSFFSEKLWLELKSKMNRWRQYPVVVSAWKDFVLELTKKMIESLTDQNAILERIDIKSRKLSKKADINGGDLSVLPDFFEDIDGYLEMLGQDRMRAKRDIVVEIQEFPPGFEIDLSRSKPIVVKVTDDLHNQHGVSDGDSIVSIGGNPQRKNTALETRQFIENSKPPLRIKFRKENFETMFAAWDRFLHIMGSLTEIEDCATSLSALGGFTDCLNIILTAINTSRHVEKSRKVKAKAAAASGALKELVADKNVIENLPQRCEMPEAETLLSVFGCDLFSVMNQFDWEKASYEPHLLFAFRSLCRIFFMRNQTPIPDFWLLQFYVLCEKLFTSSRIQPKLLSYMKPLFSCDMSCSSLLILPFMKLFSASFSINSPQMVDLCSAMSLPLIGICYQFPPDSQIHHLSDPSETIAISELKEKLIASYFKMIETPICFPTAVSALTVFIFHELYIETQPDVKLIYSCIEHLTLAIGAESPEESTYAVQCIRSLSHLSLDLEALSDDISVSNVYIFKPCIEAARRLLTKATVSRDPEWISATNMVMLCLLDWVCELSQAADVSEIMQDYIAFLFLVMKKKSFDFSLKLEQLKKDPLYSLYEHADICRTHLWTYLNNFPFAQSENGTNTSCVSEVDEPFSGIHLVYNNSVLLTCTDFCLNHESNEWSARLICRSKAGKFVWDFQPSDLPENVASVFQPPMSSTRGSSFGHVDCPSAVPAGGKRLPSKLINAVVEKPRAKASLDDASPRTQRGADVAGENFVFREGEVRLQQVVNFAVDNFTDDSKRSAKQRKVKNDAEEYLQQLRVQVKMHIQAEEEQADQYTRYTSMSHAANTLSVSDDYLSDSAHHRKHPQMKLTDWDRSRYLLAHLGILIPNEALNDSKSIQSSIGSGMGSLQALSSPSKVQLGLKLLDRVWSREVNKIGLVYVSEGQDEQTHIFHNEKGSASYERFLGKIGDKIDISLHHGFKGGLTARETGKFSIYHASSTTEMMFHVVTMMPNKKNDPQQIPKKRHIGNDQVKIIWSEHYRDYLPTTIISSFNHVNIIVYPKSNENLYQVRIVKEENVGLFGPLQDGMLIREEVLAKLIRITALNANRTVRYANRAYQHPYPTRENYLREIIDRYADPSPQKLLEALFPSIKLDEPSLTQSVSDRS